MRDDLELRILVVEDGDTRAALVTCDLLAMTRDTSDPIRAAVAEVLDAPAAAVLTSCTHVHAGPERAHRHRRDRLAGARRPPRAAGRPGDRRRSAAVAALAPSTARFVRTPLPADVAMNRRGHALTPSASIVVFDGVTIVANFGIHPTVTGPSNLAGRDRLGRPVPAVPSNATPACPRASSRAARAT